MPGINTPGSAYPGQYDASGPIAYTLTVAGASIAVVGGDATFTLTVPMTGGWALGSLYPGQYYNQELQAYSLTAAGASVAVVGGEATLTVTPAPIPAPAGGPLLWPRRPHRAAQHYALYVDPAYVPCLGGLVSFRLISGRVADRTDMDQAWRTLQQAEDDALVSLLIAAGIL